MIPKLWLRLLMLLALWVAFVAVTLHSLAAVAYDWQCPVSVSYDSQAFCGFDGSEMQSTGENCRESAGLNPLLTAFSKFLAAESAGGKDPGILT